MIDHAFDYKYGVPYTSVPTSLSVDGCQLAPYGTDRTSLQPHCYLGQVLIVVKGKHWLIFAYYLE